MIENGLYEFIWGIALWLMQVIAWFFNNILAWYGEDLIARCTLFPEPKNILEDLREKNPGARTVIVDRLLGAMRRRLADEGK